MLSKIIGGIALSWQITYLGIAFVLWDIDWVRHAGVDMTSTGRLIILGIYCMATSIGMTPLWIALILSTED